MLAKLRQLIHDGEGLTVEFKRCTNELTNSFLKRYRHSHTDTIAIPCSASRITAQSAA